MNKTAGTFVFALFFGATVLAGCSKDKQAPPPDPTKILTGTNWQLTNEFYEKSGDPSSKVDLFTTHYAECERDDIYRFQTDGMLLRSDSAVSCGSGYHPYGFYTGGSWTATANVDTLGL